MANAGIKGSYISFFTYYHPFLLHSYNLHEFVSSKHRKGLDPNPCNHHNKNVTAMDSVLMTEYGLLPLDRFPVIHWAGIWTVRTYREAYKLFMSNSILFNHESEVRDPEFVTRKSYMAVAKIAHGSKDPVMLGNLSAVKDWGYARDYVEGMWKMLQQDYSADFVLGTNESHTVREFAGAAFRTIGTSIT